MSTNFTLAVVTEDTDVTRVEGEQSDPRVSEELAKDTPNDEIILHHHSRRVGPTWRLQNGIPHVREVPCAYKTQLRKLCCMSELCYTF